GLAQARQLAGDQARRHAAVGGQAGVGQLEGEREPVRPRARVYAKRHVAAAVGDRVAERDEAEAAGHRGALSRARRSARTIVRVAAVAVAGKGWAGFRAAALWAPPSCPGLAVADLGRTVNAKPPAGTWHPLAPPRRDRR